MFVISYIETRPDSIAMVSAACLALAVGLFAWTMLSILTNPRRSDFNYFEQQRREQLRRASATYRWFEPLVDEIARLHGSQNASKRKLAHNLALDPKAPPWKPAEFVATKQIEAGVLAFFLGIMLARTANPIVGIVVAVFVIVVYQTQAVASVADKAKRRTLQFKKRLPYTIDLMALMMEAGADFTASVQTVVLESKDHPVGEVFGRVLSEIEHGKTRRSAFEKLRDQFDDDDVNEIVFAINKGEELGTPLAKILRIQADQMRMKRSQWAEKASGQAQVQIVFPGMLTMVACLLVIVAPFLLKALNAL